MKKTITYTYRGQVERGNGKPGYDWHRGYSETTESGGILCPWMTRAECIADAKGRGAVAQFYSGPGDEPSEFKL